jgi:hypothetical protein
VEYRITPLVLELPILTQFLTFLQKLFEDGHPVVRTSNLEICSMLGKVQNTVFSILRSCSTTSSKAQISKSLKNITVPAVTHEVLNGIEQVDTQYFCPGSRQYKLSFTMSSSSLFNCGF